jgi:hypothetical protein
MFKMGGVDLPTVEDWHAQTDVRGTTRAGDILLVDTALKAVVEASRKGDMLSKFHSLSDLITALQKAKKTTDTRGTFGKERIVHLNNLEQPVISARRYYAATGPVINTILTSPTDIYKKKEQGVTGAALADEIFSNFLIYAKAHWSYVASAQAGGEDVLSGRAVAFPCGGIANALKIVFQSFFGDSPTEFIRITGYLITKPTYSCFDAKVTGNVKSAGITDDWDGSCIFNEHYFLKYANQYYDPCMTTKYALQDEVIETRLKKVGSAPILVSTDLNHPYIYAFNSTKNVPGFNGSYVRFRIDSFSSSPELLQLFRAQHLDAFTDKDAENTAKACGKTT